TAAAIEDEGDRLRTDREERPVPLDRRTAPRHLLQTVSRQAVPVRRIGGNSLKSVPGRQALLIRFPPRIGDVRAVIARPQLARFAPPRPPFLARSYVRVSGERLVPAPAGRVDRE